MKDGKARDHGPKQERQDPSENDEEVQGCDEVVTGVLKVWRHDGHEPQERRPAV
eukprot:CAMPEP_0202048118 /NCGR_PEP_ID=MMETSP0963-20130614/2465_1 /ASSEMBLY_ACC=CAM_ASM_000494 /TAXON_ID=4773 /ORGANISM="Schizochytrium aggregatum, Strain ATCC28209" /LENGTH=53 /DNA_ID=CAMNT_0048612963 /DNA_START=579 /DNA_END=736 /DNA_ORIENTATION=+